MSDVRSDASATATSASESAGTSAASAAVREIRAADIDVSVRHQAIMGAIDALVPGQAVRLRVDHEPKPLFYTLQAERPGLVSWQPELEGPREWVVLVRRLPGAA
jgi:uncharacterized protein (DUF2249 family)